jgi:hypothetical protein
VGQHGNSATARGHVSRVWRVVLCVWRGAHYAASAVQ